MPLKKQSVDIHNLLEVNVSSLNTINVQFPTFTCLCNSTFNKNI